MIPKHTTPRDKGRRAHAPYNFIPLPNVVVPAQPLPDQNTYHSDRKTGQIVCRLETKTPLFTRGAVRRALFQRYNQLNLESLKTAVEVRAYADFFRYDENGQPVISGSSLRGLIRAMCEVIGYAKVQWVTDKELIYRAVGSISSVGDMYRERFFGKPSQGMVDGQPTFIIQYPASWVHGGYLRRIGSDWFIQPARLDSYGSSFAHVDYHACQAAGLMNGNNYSPAKRRIWIAPPRRVLTSRRRYGSQWISFQFVETNEIEDDQGQANPPQPGWVRGTLVMSHHFGTPSSQHSKHRHVVIYEQDDGADSLEVADELMAQLKADEELSRKRDHEPRKIAHQNGAPVMYMVDPQNEKKVIFLGPTKMFRLPYKWSPLDFVPEELRDEQVIDLAEAVFGFVRSATPQRDETSEQAKQRAYAGRVFFSDARLLKDIVEQPLATPKVLSAPKPTSFQLYLVQDAANDNGQTRGKYLFHYDVDPAKLRTVIRGIKQYWHQDEAWAQEHLSTRSESFTVNDLPNQQKKSLTVIRPVPAGAEFEFRMRFENLTPEELGLLLWALQLPPEQNLCHHLGMAKPYGLGTVKITPHLFLENRQERYNSLFSTDPGGSHTWSGLCQPQAQDAEDDAQPYLTAFEAYVIRALPDDLRQDGLAGQPRIQDLVAMLRFPGPEDVEYGEIQGPESDMFKHRKVLPTPREVMGQTAMPQPVRTVSPQPEPRRPEREELPRDNPDPDATRRANNFMSELNRLWDERDKKEQKKKKGKKKR